MPTINFLKQFAPLVESGAKRQTVRTHRKRPIAPGDILYLYTGMRTRSCRKLRTETCRMTREVQIPEHGGLILDGQALYQKSLDRFSRADGFGDWEEMKLFFEKTHGLPFAGVVIYW